jgi:hypothetical protein
MRRLVCVFAAVVAASVASVASAARAQGEDAGASLPELRWLVVPALGGVSEAESEGASVDALHTFAEALRQELVVRGGAVWRADRASERFEVVGSAPPPRLSQSDIDLWVERSRAAVRYLARADYKAARRELKAAQRLADRAAAELNREAARAQQVLDTCLFMVRAYVETKNDAEARRQARECRRLVPRVEPSAFRHTPEVRDLLAQVDEEMASEAPGTLSVQSTPSGCLVRINGVAFGRTPLGDIELPVGAYRLQVECEGDQRGRIHRVGIVSGENVFALDAALERAVHTRPVLHLEYDEAAAWAARTDHAREVAATLGGGSAMVVSGPSTRAMRVDLSAEEYEPASAWIAVRDGVPETEDVRRVVDALLEGRSVDFTGPHPIARASWQAATGVGVGAATVATTESASEPKGGVPRPRGQRIAGWSLFGLGVASIGASVGLHVWRGELGDSFTESPANLNSAQQWYDARIGVWTTAAFGGAATSAAMPLLLPNYERTPWWGWALGAAGLGLTGYAIYEGVTMTRCPEPYIADQAAVRACVARGQEAGRLALALAGAAPLLTIPLVYLFRPLRAEPSVSVTGQGAVVQVRKVF